MRVNQFTKRALLKEFPWLKEIKHGQGEYETSVINLADDVVIKRLDNKFFDHVPQDESHRGSMGDSGSWEKYWIVTLQGQPERLAVTYEEHHASNYAHEGTQSCRGLPLADSFANLEKIDDIQYIVCFERSWSNWSGSDLYDGFTLTVYKPSKEGGLINRVLDDYNKRAAAEVRAAISF